MMNELNRKEELKTKSKVTIFLISIGIILGIVAIVFILSKENFKENNPENTTQEMENEKTEKETQYVIDANYKAEVTKESYKFYKETIKITDLVFPYLNMETSAANEINQEIKKLYDEYVEMYEGFSNENLDYNENETESFDYVRTDYSYTINNEIVSIVIKVDRTGRGSSQAEEYYTFNYDLKEDKRISFNDLVQKYNLNITDINNIVYKKIETSITNTYEGYENQQELNEYNTQNKEYYKKSIQNNNSLIYIDEENKLNILVYIEHPCGGSGFYYEKVTIAK